MDINTNNKTTKPMTLVRNEFIASIVALCNNSGLPFFVVEDVLKNLIQEVHVAAQQQLKDDNERYQALLKQQEEKQEDK